MPEIRKSNKEHFVAIYLDSRGAEISRGNVSVGTVNASLVHPREVFNEAIKCHACSVIGIHNHPSNNTEPSDADVAITKRLVESGRILGIEFEDHIIITKEHYLSLRDEMDEIFD